MTAVDPAGLGATLEATLAGGTYTLVLDGVGPGDSRTTGYSDYGSVGRYRLSGTLPSGETVENRAPVAALTATPTSGTAPLAVSLDASGSSDPDGDTLTHTWDIGDGTTASGVSAAHTYAAGPHVATLTVSDGALSSTASTTVTVDEPATVVSAPAKPVLTSAQSNGSVVLDWGDDATVESFSVYRETRHRNGSYRSRTLLATLGGATSTWTDKPGSGTFRYQVVAQNAGGTAQSDHSYVTVSSTSTKTTGKGSTRAGTMKAR